MELYLPTWKLSTQPTQDGPLKPNMTVQRLHLAMLKLLATITPGQEPGIHYQAGALHLIYLLCCPSRKVCSLSKATAAQNKDRLLTPDAPHMNVLHAGEAANPEALTDSLHISVLELQTAEMSKCFFWYSYLNCCSCQKRIKLKAL